MMSGVFGAIEQSETSSYAYLLYISVVLFMCFLILNKSLVAKQGSHGRHCDD